MARSNQRDEVREKVNECLVWWRNNCLYLSEEAREAFSDAYMAASLHPNLSGEERKANWSKILAAGPALTRGVALPPIGQDEPEEPGDG